MKCCEDKDYLQLIFILNNCNNNILSSQIPIIIEHLIELFQLGYCPPIIGYQFWYVKRNQIKTFRGYIENIIGFSYDDYIQGYDDHENKIYIEDYRNYKNYKKNLLILSIQNIFFDLKCYSLFSKYLRFYYLLAIILTYSWPQEVRRRSCTDHVFNYKLLKFYQDINLRQKITSSSSINLNTEDLSNLYVRLHNVIKIYEIYANIGSEIEAYKKAELDTIVYILDIIENKKKFYIKYY
jgi:hypothetical protein